MIYPSYYRNNGRCIKVLTPTVVNLITLPPDAPVPLRDIVTYPSTALLLEELKTYSPSNADTWKGFLFEFYRRVKAEHELALNHL